MNRTIASHWARLSMILALTSMALGRIVDAESRRKPRRRPSRVRSPITTERQARSSGRAETEYQKLQQQIDEMKAAHRS